MGDSGSGKSSLIANWVEHWRKDHPNDFIFQHYFGGTTDSAIHWKLMTRLMSEIKKWGGDNEELPRSNDDINRDFPVWLAKARNKAEQDGVRFIVILDALNQLEDKDHAHTLGWLPVEPFIGNSRLILSTLPGATLEALEKRSLPILKIELLTQEEGGRLIVEYLKRFGKSLDSSRIERISKTKAASNPLFLKILLDELRVTGTHEKLDERLDNYLKSKNIPSLLRNIIDRYQRDYEHEREGLVSDALGLIWSARRGLSEAELLKLLRPEYLPQLPLAIWSPLRAALEENLIDREGILNFAHDFYRTAVETTFVSDLDKKDELRTRLAGYFEALPPTSRSCDELPWLLWKTELFERLRACLLNIDFFLEIIKHDEDELRSYWVEIGEEKSMGQAYIYSFKRWMVTREDEMISLSANQLGVFLFGVALYDETEILYRLSLKLGEDCYGKDHPNVAQYLNNLALLLKFTNRMSEAEPLMQRTIRIFERNLGENHPTIALGLNNLAQLLQDTDRLSEAEPLLRRGLRIHEDNFGKNHPNVATSLNNLALLLYRTNRSTEALTLMKRVIEIHENSFGENHPNLATSLNNLAQMLKGTNQIEGVELYMEKALKIDENVFGRDHPNVARDLNNLAHFLLYTNRASEAEPMIKRALKIREDIFGKDHPEVAFSLECLASFLQATNRMSEAEQVYRRVIVILFNFIHTAGQLHPKFQIALSNYMGLLETMGWNDEKITTHLRKIIPELFK